MWVSWASEVYFDTETADIKIEEFVKYIQSEIPYPPYMERNDTNNVKNTKFIKKVITLSKEQSIEQRAQTDLMFKRLVKH